MAKSGTILLAHGSGGKLSHELVESVFVSRFDSPELAPLGDSALLVVETAKLAFTTDSYVVKPPFFPGGDIGKLAVCGTLNDLAVAGAKPLFLSCGFILEEGLPISDLERIVDSMASAAKTAGVRLVTGDTKVVERGSADRIFINTAGIGIRQPGVELSPNRVCPGDRVLINGWIGDHGVAVLSRREGLSFESEVISDCAPLNELIEVMLAAAPGIRFMRDPTRGGLATTLNEVAANRDFGVVLDESALPVRASVRAVCELLGLDPLYIANEGKVAAVVPPDQSDALLDAMRGHPLGADSAVIGEVTESSPGRVLLKTGIGGMRIVDMLAGEQLPRIC